MGDPKIASAGVKIMRSYDYCHFEISLGTTADDGLTPGDVRTVREEAARLVDEAVERYKEARTKEREAYMKPNVELEDDDEWEEEDAF